MTSNRFRVGIDVGGANIKTAILSPENADFSGPGDVRAWSKPLPLWQNKEQLFACLEEIAPQLPDNSGIAVTMTGEIADCFSSKQEGVRFIANCASTTLQQPVLFYQTNGRFVSLEEACDNYLKTAAANWHALAAFGARFLHPVKTKFDTGPIDSGSSVRGLIVDIGSTTTDIIPISNGIVAANGLTDTGRILNSELVYTGVVRSPVCTVLPSIDIEGVEVPIAQEVFATMFDAHLLAGNLPENSSDFRTADHRPALKNACLQRMARMLCADASELSSEILTGLASSAVAAQKRLIANAILNVCSANGLTDEPVLITGEGAWFAAEIVRDVLPDSRQLRLSEILSTEACACAPAVAVAVLASEKFSAVPVSTSEIR